MFSMHSRGDLVSYLRGQGFTVSESEDEQDLRAAASLCAQTVAIERSSTFKQVMVYAEKVLRKQGIAGSDTAPPQPSIVYSTVDEEREKDRYYGYDELF